MIGSVLKYIDLAEAINESFSSVVEDIPQLNFTPIPITDIPDEYTITQEAVELAFAVIQKRKSIGPDEIPNWLLKIYAPVISNPVCSIFNSSDREGYVPSLWKCADVLLLGKSPNRSLSTLTLDQYL